MVLLQFCLAPIQITNCSAIGVNIVTTQSGNRVSNVYFIMGLLLLSTGVVLALSISILLLDDTLQQKVEQHTQFLLIPGTPVFELLPATQTPLPTPTITSTPTQNPSPTPTLTPAPPSRLRIPYIGVNSMVIDVEPEVYLSYSGVKKARWSVPAYAVGHFFNSGNPGAGTNIVLSGHNNFLGEVFRNFYLLKPGIEIVLYSNTGEFHYSISEVTVVPYLRNPTQGEQILQQYIEATSTEQLTLISCYPYLTNSDRIVVVAKPLELSMTKPSGP